MAESEGGLYTLKQPKTILRIVEFFTGVISAATMGNSGYYQATQASFMLFTSIMAILLVLVFLFFYFVPAASNFNIGSKNGVVQIDFFVTLLWVLFWLAASLATAVTCNPCSDNWKASSAFGFFNTILWGFSGFYAFLAWKGN